MLTVWCMHADCVVLVCLLCCVCILTVCGACMPTVWCMQADLAHEAELELLMSGLPQYDDQYNAQLEDAYLQALEDRKRAEATAKANVAYLALVLFSTNSLSLSLSFSLSLPISCLSFSVCVCVSLSCDYRSAALFGLFTTYCQAVLFCVCLTNCGLAPGDRCQA